MDVAVPKTPMPDSHVYEGMGATFELRDGQGKLVHTGRLGEVPQGFDTTITPGEFYEQPMLHMRYHCEKVEEGMVHWTLLESYQHGRLIQARFTQKLRYGTDFVPVTDPKIRDRLQRLLERMRSRIQFTRVS